MDSTWNFQQKLWNRRQFSSFYKAKTLRWMPKPYPNMSTNFWQVLSPSSQIEIFNEDSLLDIKEGTDMQDSGGKDTLATPDHFKNLWKWRVSETKIHSLEPVVWKHSNKGSLILAGEDWVPTGTTILWLRAASLVWSIHTWEISRVWAWPPIRIQIEKTYGMFSPTGMAAQRSFSSWFLSKCVRPHIVAVIERGVKVAQSRPTLFDLMDSPWNSPGQNIGVGSH